MRPELLAALEKQQFDQKRTANHLAARSLDELAGGAHRAASSQEIVHEQNVRARADAVGVDLQLRAAVFQVVFQRVRAVRQLSGLPQRHERTFQLQGEGRREQETTCFSRCDRIHGPVLVVFRHPINGFLKRPWLGQERGNILKENPLLGKIGNVADVLLEIHDGVLFRRS